MRLSDLVSGLSQFSGTKIPDLDISGVRADSQEVGPGDLFVAIRGSQHDGHVYIAEAADRGAAAAIVERRTDHEFGIPAIPVDDTRAALAELAAAWNGRPADSMQVVGITGTVGKTSVLSILERIMKQSGVEIGAIGSLGVHLGERVLADTGFTAPDPLLLHEKLSELREAGCELLAMEVTSHALDQHRVHGMRFQVGIFTNLLPLEHQDYHGSFEEYVAAKIRFFDHLPPASPLVYNVDDRAVDTLVRERDLEPVGVGHGEDARVEIRRSSVSASGTQVLLRVNRSLPGPSGARIEPLELPLNLQLLGRSNVYNAALAATTGLMLGAKPEAVREALQQLPPPRRRVEVIHDGLFSVIDDTAGHPDSVNALFEAIEALQPERLHFVVGIRGSRGMEINRHTAETIATWGKRRPFHSLAITASEDAADDRNRVHEEERRAFLEPLESAGVRFQEHAKLTDAVNSVLPEVREGDLVVLLGAQGMNAAADMVRQWLQEHGSEANPTSATSKA